EQEFHLRDQVLQSAFDLCGGADQADHFAGVQIVGGQSDFDPLHQRGGGDRLDWLGIHFVLSKLAKRSSCVAGYIRGSSPRLSVVKSSRCSTPHEQHCIKYPRWLTILGRISSPN